MNCADRVKLIVPAAQKHLGFSNADFMLETSNK
jgi:hypothetical protein